MILYYKIHPSICNLHAITAHPWCNGKYKPLSLYHPFFFLVPANTEEIETRLSLRAIKHWRHFLLPRLLLQFFVFFLIMQPVHCLFRLLQKVCTAEVILIIQFTQLSQGIVLFWKICENILLFPVSVSDIWGIFKSKCIIWGVISSKKKKCIERPRFMILFQENL